MQTYEREKIWPYVERLTPDHAADQQERLGRMNLFHCIGLRLEKLATDYSRLSITPGVELVRNRSTLQGGVLATLVDAAASEALRTTLKTDHNAVTIHLDTKYFQPLHQERVWAEGTVVRKGCDLAHVCVTVVDEAGALVARGWCVQKITRSREPETIRVSQAVTKRFVVRNLLPRPARP
jgi:uncharacterized protein (TIGR00369 family)